MRKELWQRLMCAVQSGAGVGMIMLLKYEWADTPLLIRGLSILALLLLAYLIYRYIFTDNVLCDTGWKKEPKDSPKQAV